MKYFIVFLVVGIPFVSFLQDEGAVFDFKKKDKPSDKQGDKYISIYYGMPHLEKSWQTSLLKSGMANNENIQDIKSSGFGPIGVRGEYFVSNIVALGVDAFYNKYNITFKDVYQVYDPTYTYMLDKEDEYKYTMERLRIQFRANFYFNIKDPNVQLYGGVGIGLNYRNISFRKNGEIESKINAYLQSSMLVLPISSRICFGYRQMIKNKFGISFEAGFGDPLFSL